MQFSECWIFTEIWSVAPIQNGTRRAQERHFEYKNVTSFRGLCPWLPDHRLCPWTPLGVPPQTSVIGSHSALAMHVPSELNSSLCSTKCFFKYALFLTAIVRVRYIGLPIDYSCYSSWQLYSTYTEWQLYDPQLIVADQDDDNAACSQPFHCEELELFCCFDVLASRLRLVLNAERYDYMDDTLSAGLHLILHAPGGPPSLISRNIVLSAGSHNFISVRRQAVRVCSSHTSV